MRRVIKSLKECPACGAKEVTVSDMLRLAFTDYISDEKREELAGLYCVRCENELGGGCHSTTPPFDTEQKAIDYWQEVVIPLSDLKIGGDINAIKAMSKMHQ